MRIVITGINTTQSDDVRVSFASEYGNGKAQWRGASPVTFPLLNRGYTVEIEVPEMLKWGNEIRPSVLQNCKIDQHGSSVILVGQLESFEEDGYAVIWLGNSILSLETEGNPPPIGTFVEVSTSQLQLYEY